MHSEVVELAQGLSTAANTSQNNIPGAMERQGRWSLERRERKLFLRNIHLGADNSIIRDYEPIFSVSAPQWGQIGEGRWYMHVEPLHRPRVVLGPRWFFADEVISAIRGPGFLAVRALQRSFRRKRYVQWYNENHAWDHFIEVAQAFAVCRGRLVRKIKISPFCPGPPWAYVPEPVVHAGAVRAPAFGMLHGSVAGFRHGSVTGFRPV